MADEIADKVIHATVTIEMNVQSVTVNEETMADILYNRTITDDSTKEVIVRDVMRVSEPVITVQPIIDKAIERAKAKKATGDE